VAIVKDLRLECPDAETAAVLDGLPLSVSPSHDDKIRHWGTTSSSFDSTDSGR
jgi:hypothetical protein